MAREVAHAIEDAAPSLISIDGLAWKSLRGQVQSVSNREEAAATFLEARQHEHASLVADFYRDVGAFTYYSEDEIRDRPSAAVAL